MFLAFESVTLHAGSLGKRMINYNKFMCFSFGDLVACDFDQDGRFYAPS